MLQQNGVHDDDVDSGLLSERDTVTFAQRRKSYSSEWQRLRFLWHMSGGSVFLVEGEGQGGWWMVWRWNWKELWAGSSVRSLVHARISHLFNGQEL